MQPTQEQQDAIDAFLSGKSLKVNAFAGTGKTSTLQMMARSDNREGVYIAFNKSIATEAAQRFPENVHAQTSHSLAYRAVLNRGYTQEEMTGKLNTNAVAERMQLGSLDIDGHRQLSRRDHAYLIVECLKRFTQSDLLEPSVEHVPLIGSIAQLAQEGNTGALEELRRQVVRGTKQLWGNMTTPGKPAFPLGHDGYFKLWSLSNPRLDAEYIFLDEAQDSNPALLSVLSEQDAQIIYVGDRFQQIYQWRGAVNAMERIKTPNELQLTQSFRFGDAIADVANRILHLLDESATVRGNPSISSVIGCANPDTVLSRTNGSLIGYVLAAAASGRSAHVVGGTQELTWMLEDVSRLKSGRPATHPEFFGYKNWNEVQAATLRPDGQHLKTFVTIVDSHGERAVISALSHTQPDERGADLILSTAHKSKGREWSGVMLDDDFFQPYSEPLDSTKSNTAWISGNKIVGPVDRQVYDYSPEEVRLLYVACTRAINQLQIPRWCTTFFGIHQSVAKMRLEPKPRQSPTPPGLEPLVLGPEDWPPHQPGVKRSEVIPRWVWVVAVVILLILLIRLPAPVTEQTHQGSTPPTSTKEPVFPGPSIPTPQPEEAADPVSGQAAIGDAYFQERSYKLAAQHYIRAAVCGDVHSQAQLASMFRTGTGVKQDNERSFLWLRIAYAMGRTDHSTGVQMMQQMDLIGREAVERMAGFGDLWEVRRPDETASCMTAAQAAEPIFLVYPFDLD